MRIPLPLLPPKNTDVKSQLAATAMVTGMESNTARGQDERKNLLSGDTVEPPHWPWPDYSQTPLGKEKLNPLIYFSASVVTLLLS